MFRRMRLHIAAQRYHRVGISRILLSRDITEPGRAGPGKPGLPVARGRPTRQPSQRLEVRDSDSKLEPRLTEFEISPSRVRVSGSVVDLGLTVTVTPACLGGAAAPVTVPHGRVSPPPLWSGDPSPRSRPGCPGSGLHGGDDSNLHAAGPARRIRR